MQLGKKVCDSKECGQQSHESESLSSHDAHEIYVTDVYGNRDNIKELWRLVSEKVSQRRAEGRGSPH